MKTNFFLIVSIFCIFFASCKTTKEKPVQILSVVVSDTNGVLTYNWSRAKTVGNTTVIPTGVPLEEMGAEGGLSLNLVTRSQIITKDFEEKFNLQILGAPKLIKIKDSTQVYLWLAHEAAPLVSNQTMQKAEGLVDKTVDKVKEIWSGIKSK